MNAIARGRPFQPGVSGNPGGRPRSLGTLRLLARAHAAEAIAELARLAVHAKSETAIGSPLGRAILGAEEGDEVELPLENNRQRKVLIESVEKGPPSVAVPLDIASSANGAVAVA